MHATLGQFPFKYRMLLYSALISLGIEYSLRLVSHLRQNVPWARLYGLRQRSTTCRLEAIAGATRIMISIPGCSVPRPGQYVYISIPAIGLLQYHPFSIAWHDGRATKDELRMLPDLTNNSLTLVAKAKDGFTRSLYQRAKVYADEMTCLVDGPYGQRHNLDIYDEVLMICGGIGITSVLLHMKHHLEHLHEFPQQRIVLIWVIRTGEEIKWIEPELETLLQDNPQSISFNIYITTATSSPKSGYTIHSGRPDLTTLITEAITHRFGTLCVFTCGPGAMTDSIRRSVCRSLTPCVTFIEDSYSW